jgi:hypothetical protein
MEFRCKAMRSPTIDLFFRWIENPHAKENSQPIGQAGIGKTQDQVDHPQSIPCLHSSIPYSIP